MTRIWIISDAPGWKKGFYGKVMHFDHHGLLTVTLLDPTIKLQNISGADADLLYMLHLQLHKWQNVYYSCGIGNLQYDVKIRFFSSQRRSDSSVPRTPFLSQQRREDQTWMSVLCSCVNSACSEPVLRHYIPLGQWAGHLRVHKVGLQLPFALDVDDASTRAHVAQGQKDSTRLFCHLQGEADGSRPFCLFYTTGFTSCRRKHSAPLGNTCPGAGEKSAHHK